MQMMMAALAPAAPPVVPVVGSSLDCSGLRLRTFSSDALAEAAVAQRRRPSEQPLPPLDTVQVQNHSPTRSAALGGRRDSAVGGRGAQALDLSCNFVRAFDAAALAPFVALRELYLGANELAAVPDLGALPSLVRLHLNNNRLAEVPSTLARLPALQVLDLRSNLIRTCTGLPPLPALTRYGAAEEEEACKGAGGEADARG
jgi:hypothetical protein